MPLTMTAEREAEIYTLDQTEVGYDLKRELDATRVKLQKVELEMATRRRLAKDEIWFWQGDGEDHLESLTCPIIITPEALREILQKVQR